MKPFPHHYQVSAKAAEDGYATLTSHGLNPMVSAPPAEFNGPGHLWSPETLFVGAVADCFILTFKAIATAAKLRWTTLVCDAAGTLDRTEKAVRFTGIELHARLELPYQTDEEKARRLLEKAEKGMSDRQLTAVQADSPL
jgi:organic hydroperoxide reductase OsmC/OhrA